MSSDPVTPRSGDYLAARPPAACTPGRRAGQDADQAVLAADADRERTVSALQSGYAEGRLAKDEFDARAGRALAARTVGDLAEEAAGLPGRPARAARLSRPRRVRQPGPPRSPSAGARTTAVRC